MADRNKGRFQTTDWTAVFEASANDIDSREAFAQLYQAYRYPVYAFLRGQGQGPQDAEDSLQAFFLWMIERNTIAHADPRRGRFRNFLLTALKRFLVDQHRFRNAKKRRADKPLLPLDTAATEAKYQKEDKGQVTAEMLFERSWAQTRAYISTVG